MLYAYEDFPYSGIALSESTVDWAAVKPVDTNGTISKEVEEKKTKAFLEMKVTPSILKSGKNE